MPETFASRISELPVGAVLGLLHVMVDDIQHGRDSAIAALARCAATIGATPMLVGGVAVIVHGYPRPTTDRDVLVHYRQAPALAEVLAEDPEWERLEIRQYCFLHKPSGMQVDFLVSGDLMELGRPYLFPDPETIERAGEIEGIPVIGLHDLMFLKLIAGRMRDLGDLMELCKLHLEHIEPERVVGRIQPEDNDLREKFLDILKKAPIELANEQRLGQGVRKTPLADG